MSTYALLPQMLVEHPSDYIPLIDADILCYEICWGVEYGKEYIPPFEQVGDALDLRIANILAEIETTAQPKLFLTGSSNFRFDLATTKPYKNRDHDKRPYHFDNIRAYMVGMYGATIIEGMEADDAMCIEANKDPNAYIICTRDKDLRMQTCWHYGWELGKQPRYGPAFVSYLGEWIDGRIPAVGIRLFYYQLLVGDTVDNIPGLPGCGPVKAKSALKKCNTEIEMYEICADLYKTKYGSEWYDKLLEQGRLLWMVNELNEDGSPKMWTPPNGG